MAKSVKSTKKELTVDNVENVPELAQPEITPEVVVENEEKVVEPVVDVVVEKKLEVVSEELTDEEKIVKFLESRSGGYVKVNDFLKSLFPLPKTPNEPPVWLMQGAAKRLRVLLEGMRLKGLIKIANNTHLLLGTFYYPDTSHMKTAHHTLNSVQIQCSL